MIVVISNVTGAQGQAIVERFWEQKDNNLRVRGLTRNKDSDKARDLLRGKEDLLELYSVDYNDLTSLKDAFQGADALFLNVIMSRKESLQYHHLLEAARDSGTIRHVVYSSSAECQRNHGVPHWETSWRTEQYLKQFQQQQQQQQQQEEDKLPFVYHVLRYAHCNENMLTFYKPSNTGWMAFPWDPSVRVHTASVRDGARVACKLFRNPHALPNGHILDVVADFCSPHEMADAVGAAKNQTIRAYKGPWVLLNIASMLAYEPASITTMGGFIETHWNKDIMPNGDEGIRDFLRDEIEEGECLESVKAFCRRHFGTGRH